MDIKIINLDEKKIAVFKSNDIIIKSERDALDLMANAPSDYIVLYKHNFEENFFDLSTKIAGEILQKFTTYQVKLAIIGDFSKYKSRSLHDFIYESNKNKEYLFVDTLEKAIEIWGGSVQKN